MPWLIYMDENLSYDDFISESTHEGDGQPDWNAQDGTDNAIDKAERPRGSHKQSAEISRGCLTVCYVIIACHDAI